MEKLIDQLKTILGTNFALYFKAHSYHWNVEGHLFPMYHKFFRKIYEDVYGAVDPLSEELRKLDAYAPISLEEIHSYKTIIEDIPEQNRCGDIWKLINPETKEVVSPESNEPKQWVHTDY